MSIELDYMEYASDALAQAAYVTDAEGGEEDIMAIVTTNDTYNLNKNIRILIPASALDFSAPKIKVSLTAALVDYRCVVDSCYIGHPAEAGDPYDFDGNQVEVKFGGTSGVTMEIGETATSDATTFDLDSSKDLIVSFHLDTVYAGGRYKIGMTGFVTYFKVGADESGVTDVTGYGAWGNEVNSVFQIIGIIPYLQSYSESGIKEQGTYSLKGVAAQTDSLNDCLERTISSPIDLSGRDTIKFDIYALRTGAHIKIGIRDSGLVWTEKTYTVIDSNTWETVTWDISGVADADKDAIDRVKITILNADAANVFYLDNMYAEAIIRAILDSGVGTDTITLIKAKVGVSDSGAGTDIIAAVKALLLLQDSGVGADIIAELKAKLDLSDTGVGTDAVYLKALLTLLDSGVGVDSVQPVGVVDIADSGVGADALAIKAIISLADSGVGAELLSILAKISVSDSGVGTDTIAFIKAILELADAGVGVEQITVGVGMAIQDSGVGADILSILAKVGITDAGVGADILSVLVKLLVQDSGVGTDTITLIKALVDLVDSGVGLDEIGIGVSLSVLDSAVGVDVLSVLAKLAIQDSGMGTDAIAMIKALVSIADSGRGLEFFAIKAIVSMVTNFICEAIGHLENEDDFIGVLEGDDNFVGVLQQEQEEAEMEELDYVPEVYVAILGDPQSLLGELEEGGEFSGDLKDDE